MGRLSCLVAIGTLVLTGSALSGPAQRAAQDERMVTLSLSRHLVATGRTRSPGAPADCPTNVEVRLLRKRASGWSRVATTTATDGSFRVTLPDRTGRYVAVVAETTVDPGQECAAARSNVARHRHI